MLKGSFSLSTLRWLDVAELDDVFDLVDQKFLRSVGDGWRDGDQDHGIYKYLATAHTGR